MCHLSMEEYCKQEWGGRGGWGEGGREGMRGCRLLRQDMLGTDCYVRSVFHEPVHSLSKAMQTLHHIFLNDQAGKQRDQAHHGLDSDWLTTAI